MKYVRIGLLIMFGLFLLILIFSTSNKLTCSPNNPYAYFAKSIVVVTPDNSTPWPGKSNVPPSWIHKFSDVNDAYKFLGDRWQKLGGEGGDFKFGRQGEISEIVDLPPGKNYLFSAVKESYPFNLDIIYDYKKSGFQYLGYDHSHNNTTDFTGEDFAAYYLYSEYNSRYSLDTSSGSFNVFNKKSGIWEFYCVDKESSIRYVESGGGNLKEDWGNLFFNSSIVKVKPVQN